MFRNYLTVALRNLFRHKLYSFINLAGLSIGFVCAIFIMLFVRDEVSYDKWIPGSENLYLVQTSYHALNLPPSPWSTSPFPLVSAMKDEIPEVTAFTRHRQEPMTIYIGDRQFAEQVTVADQNFFELIRLPLLTGDPARVLGEANSVVLSREMAVKFFGTSDAAGKTILISRTKCGPATPAVPAAPVAAALSAVPAASATATASSPTSTPPACRLLSQPMTVTGVMLDLPRNTHLALDMVVPVNSIVSDLTPALKSSWINNSVRGYVQLAPGADPNAVLAKINGLADKNITTQTATDGTTKGSSYMYSELVPFWNIHFANRNNKNPPLTPAGSWANVYGFAAIGVMIILLACFNFTNLATARATMRAREISLRKVMGAKRSQLVFQFLSEAFLMAFVSLMLALMLVEVLMPVFNAVLSQAITLRYLQDWPLMLVIGGIGALVGLLSGIYPAFVLSRFRPATVLRTNASSQSGSAFFRTALVALQFAVSIGLGIAVLVVFAQVTYLQNTDLGFDRQNVVILDATDIPAATRESLLRALVTSAEISDVAKSSRVPFDGGLLRTQVRKLSETDVRTAQTAESTSSSPGFHKVYRIPLLAGRLLTEERGGDITVLNQPHNLVVSAALAQMLGWTPQQAIGKTIYVGTANWEATIVGVVGNLSVQGPKIEPLPVLYRNFPTNQTFIAVRVRDGRMGGALPFIEKTWQNFAPSIAMRRQFLTDNYARLLDSDNRQSTIFNIFVVIAIFIACLGLFGLAAFTAERRTKETGLRKVFGAKTKDIVRLILWQFSMPVLVANLIAWPIAYYYLNLWLKNYTLKISLNPLFFVGPALVALLIACATIYVQARRVARANPINALRYE